MVSVLSDSRQAGARELEGGGKEPPRLRFDILVDGFDPRQKIVDDGDNGFPLEYFDIAEAYIKGKVEIIAQFLWRGSGGSGQLVFRAVPNRAAPGVVDKNGVCPEAKPFDLGIERDQTAMLADVGQVAQPPQFIVPSLVWLERAHRGHDFRGGILAGLRKVVIEGGFVLPESEADALEVGSGVLGEDAGADRMIEGVAQIVEGVGGNRKEKSGNVVEPSLEDILSAVRVRLYECGIGMAVEPILAAKVKFLTEFASPIEQELGAVK